MRAAFGLVALLLVLAIVGLNVRHELLAQRGLLPASTASGASSAPFGGTSSPGVAQFQRELDKTLHTVADRAASAGDEADRTH